MPVSVVVTAGFEHVTCWRQRPVQLEGTPHTLAVPPPPQVSGWLQPPHWSKPPQPSLTGPHSPAAQVLGVHLGAPQTLETPPPPQVWPVGHEPHWMMLPHPSAMGPQFTACCAQVRGVQLPPEPHTLGVPPPPQVWPD